jgi:hypothetical protein
MKHQRHFDASASALREVARICALIDDLHRVVRVLDCDIATEEERAGISDPLESGYPILARTQLARRDNLKRTIGALKRRVADRPDEVELVRLIKMANNT